MLETFKLKAKQLKKQLTAVYLAYRRKDVPWYKKAFLLLILIYAVSPIDLIPDFIPVLGLLDDLVLIPLGIFLAVKMIPKNVWKECKAEAEKGVTIQGRYKKMGASFMLLLWTIVLLLIIRCFV